MCPVGRAAAADPATEPRLAVTVHSGVLSVDTRAAPLVDALLEIGRLAGVRVHVDDGLLASLQHESVTATFAGVTVEEGLRRMLRGNDCIFVYTADRLVEAWVYSPDVSRSTVLMAPPREPDSPAPKILSTGGDADTVPGDPAQLAADAVSSPSAEVRIRALEEFSEINDHRLVRSTAVAVLHRDRDPQVLGTALEVLGHLEEPPVEPVLELLKRADDVGTRMLALDYLVGHVAADPQVRAAIERVMRSDRSAEVRNNARSALDALNDTGLAR
jgi:HEAT repeat protein